MAHVGTAGTVGPVQSDPLWEALLQIPTTRKLVRHRILNRLGCQVARVLVADTLLRARRRRLAVPPGSAQERLVRDGIVIIQDFLSGDEFDAVLHEVQAAERSLFRGQRSPDKFGMLRRKVNVLRFPDAFPTSTRLLLHNEQLVDLARVGEGWSPSDDFSTQGTKLTYEHLVQVAPVGVDLRREHEISSGDVHSDTFHAVTKAFLTLGDTTMENAPYMYARGSQRVTLARLAWEYANSVRLEQYDSDDYHNRLHDGDRERLGLAPEATEVRPNTLIVTNTFGFHCRGSMTRLGAERRMLRLDFRSSPFHLR